MKLTTEQQDAICQAADCHSIAKITSMQSLWAGQGELARLSLSSPTQAKTTSLVVKQIAFAANGKHPRGWDTRLSQQRKRHSYQVEWHWYRHYVSQASSLAPMPRLVYSAVSEGEMLMVLEDLAVNFPVRFTQGKDDRPSMQQIQSCIRWLAQLHARFLGHKADGLWQVGGYWHLDTRPDEWAAMPDSPLKQEADTLDKALRHCPYQTLIHGDAKLANFCFDQRGERVAAVDFQYVGQGPGVKDLMLLLSSVMPDQQLLTTAPALVDEYFTELQKALQQWQSQIHCEAVVDAWRPLYAVAWADFQRFLTGWSPGHWKIGEYCRQQTELALGALHRSGAC